VPAVTDLILGMHAGDQLVAVSNYDQDRAETRNLPRVGDYLNNDWEKLAEIRPTVMITQYDADRLPQGLSERARKLDIKLVNIKIERVSDIFATIELLGKILNQPDKAQTAGSGLRSRLREIENQAKSERPIRTLLVLDESGQSVAGPDTFLDDLLTISGGQNVLAGNPNRYPRIDREMLLVMNPEVVIQLQPGAGANQLQQARQFWDSVPGLAAVKNHRVYSITDWYALQPGYEIADLAGQFLQALHPLRASTTTQASDP
jgi:iron complex transport system substrate-binding protein